MMRRYKIDLEIFQGKGGKPRADGSHPDLLKEGICSWMYGDYEAGRRFRYPEEFGLLCPWLRDSLSGVLRAMETGVTFPWLYPGTPYEKEIDPDGVTTEFVRCPDPTNSGIVIKITRTALPEPPSAG